LKSKKVSSGSKTAYETEKMVKRPESRLIRLGQKSAFSLGGGTKERGGRGNFDMEVQ